MRSARLLAAGLIFSLLSGLVAVLPPLPASAAAEPGLSPVAPVARGPVVVQKPSMPKWAAPAVKWPVGGSGETTVGGALARIGGPAAVGGLQVSINEDTSGSGAVAAQGLTAAGKPVTVGVLPQTAVKALGVKGVVFSAGSAETLGGPVKMSVSYAYFGSAYGAGWGGRLRLVSMPSCALTTPALPECRVQTIVPGFVNDPVTATVSAPVALPVLSSPAAAGASAQSAAVQPEPQVFALTAGASSEAGDFAASTLNQAASWAQGGSSGDFTTSIPVKMPPVSGLSPSISLDYSSGSVDGLTKSTNNQTSVVGEGWNLGGLSFVERSYRPCKDDGGPAWSGDLCYVSAAPVSIVLNGKSSQLLVDTNGQWFAADGALGWKVERITGSPNGVKNGESFKVTTMDGTQYFFGSRDRNAGGGAMKVPVFFHDDDPQVWASCQSPPGRST